MSNARAFRRQLVDLFGPLDGAQVPGGCESCNALQTATPLGDGIWSLTIFHDDDCPVLAAAEGVAS